MKKIFFSTFLVLLSTDLYARGSAKNTSKSTGRNTSAAKKVASSALSKSTSQPARNQQKMGSAKQLSQSVGKKVSATVSTSQRRSSGSSNTDKTLPKNQSLSISTVKTAPNQEVNTMVFDARGSEPQKISDNESAAPSSSLETKSKKVDFDALNHEKASLLQLVEQLKSQNSAEKSQLSSQIQELSREKDILSAQKAELFEEKDILSKEKEKLELDQKIYEKSKNQEILIKTLMAGFYSFGVYSLQSSLNLGAHYTVPMLLLLNPATNATYSLLNKFTPNVIKNGVENVLEKTRNSLLTPYKMVESKLKASWKKGKSMENNA